MAFAPPEEDKKITLSQDADTAYIYDGMAAPGGAAEAYMTELTGETSGFSVVDSDFFKIEAPDFTQPAGEVLLAKNAATEGAVLTVKLSWQDGSCTVAVGAREGALQEEKQNGMTLMEAIDYVKEMDPADLGLEGANMDGYNVYGLSGAALVDGAPCLRLNVYRDDNVEETNVLMGMFLMTSDASHIYRLDQESGEIVEVNT